MKVFKIFSALLLSLNMSVAVQAASIANVKVVTSDAYMWLTDLAGSGDGNFSDHGFIDKAWYFTGNVSDCGGSFCVTDLESGLGLTSGDLAGLGLDTKIDTASTIYDDAKVGTFTATSGELMAAVLLKSGNENLFALFDYGVTQFWFNAGFTTLDCTKNNCSEQGLSHYVLGEIPQVPVPAAAFLFAPALLGFIGLRRKAKA